jgi:septal ring factor EnvC (AmiA/AmiB activator)
MADELPSLTLEVLKQIRDGISRLETRVDETNSRLSGLETRVDETNSRLSSVERGLNDLRIAVVHMGKVNDAVLREQMSDTERLKGIEVRLRRLEEHVGLAPQR